MDGLSYGEASDYDDLHNGEDLCNLAALQAILWIHDQCITMSQEITPRACRGPHALAMFGS